MCLPVAVLAGAALVTGAASVGMQAYGQYKAGKTAKQQAQMDAQMYARQAELANYNAAEIEKYGKINSDLVLAVGGLNNKMTQALADTNVALVNATTDFNVGIIKSTTDFNVSSAEGAAALLEQRGELEAAVHEQNAQLLEVQAQDTLEAGNQAERQSRAAYAVLKSKQRARLAANGVALDEGSALRIQADTDYASDVDADVIKTNAIKAAFGYRVSAVNERTSAAFASLDGKAKGLEKRTEAVAARINSQVAIAQAQFQGAMKNLDTKMTASVQILQETMNSQIEAFNIQNQARSDAWASRASAEGFSGQAAQARLTAKSINPALMAGTSLLSGVSQLASSWYGFNKAGAFG